MSENQTAKADVAKLRQTVSEILRRYDLVGLIESGAPDDEYDPEVGSILPRLREAESELDLTRMIHEEFVRWFGAAAAGSRDRYKAAAREIWDHWLVLRARQLSGVERATLIAAESCPVSYLGESLEPRRILRLDGRYFVELQSEPGRWWMGELQADGIIHVWGEYGSHEDAFPQH